MNQETKESLKELQAEHLRGLGAIKEQMKEDQKVLLECFKMTNEKLDRHEMKLDQHGVRLDRIETKLDEHDEKFEKIDEKFEEVHEKLDSIIETVGETKIEVTGLGHRVEVLERS